MKVMYNTLIMAFALLSVGCASILSKADYPVTFNSNPSGADILIVNKKGKQIYKGKAPYTVALPASSGFFSGERYDVKANKEGHYEANGTLSAGLDGCYIANILFGGFGLIGAICIDPNTGAMFKLADELTINLKKITETPVAPAP